MRSGRFPGLDLCPERWVICPQTSVWGGLLVPAPSARGWVESRTSVSASETRPPCGGPLSALKGTSGREWGQGRGTVVSGAGPGRCCVRGWEDSGRLSGGWGVRARPGESPLQTPPQQCADAGLLWEASRSGSCPIKIDFLEGLGDVPGAAGAPQAWLEWAPRARGIGMLRPGFAARAAGWALCPGCGPLGLMGSFTWTDEGQAGWEAAGPRGPVS